MDSIRKKVQKVGSSYFVYLPKKWVESVKLEENPYVDIVIDTNGNVIISPTKPLEEKITEKKVKLEKYEPLLAHRFITNLYLDGYNKFEVVFGQKLNKNEIKYHQKRIEELGLPVDVLEFTQEKAVFYSAESYMPLRDLLKNSLNRLLNIYRTKKNEKDIREWHRKELEKSHLSIERFFRRALINPSILLGSKLKPIDCFFISKIAEQVRELDKLYTSVNQDAREKVKKLIGLAIVLLEDLSFDKIWEYNSVLKDLEGSDVYSPLKKIERALVGWYLA